MASLLADGLNLGLTRMAEACSIASLGQRYAPFYTKVIAATARHLFRGTAFLLRTRNTISP
jgi:hypothetical protein